MNYKLCLLGFGNVGRNLVLLLDRKRDELRDRYGITWTITGVATRRLGWLANSDGLDMAALLDGKSVVHAGLAAQGIDNWLAAAKADVLFEITSLNRESGQPAIDYVRAALKHGAHAITANKGVVAHGYHALRQLAAAQGKHFLFESTVMDGTPIFSLFRESLPAAKLLRFDGLLNSTTSVILAEMEAGRSLEEGIAVAQSLGITETDPSMDIDGWDAAVKVVNLATVLMDVPIKLEQVQVQGIRGLEGATVRVARAAGTPYKLVSRVARSGEGVVATVRPEQVPSTNPMATATPEALLLHFEMDTLPSLTLYQQKAGPDTTAYGMLADFISAAQGD